MEKTKSFPKKHWIVLMIVLMFSIGTLNQNVFAATADNIEVVIPVEQKFEIFGTDLNTVSGDFDYEIKPITENAPMPIGTTNGVYKFSLSKTNSLDISIFYDTPDIYSYEISQLRPENKPEYNYNIQKYLIKIYINTDPSGNLVADVIAVREDQTKSPNILFYIKYMPLETNPSLMVDPPIKKTIKGSPSKTSIFSFVLEADNKLNPMPQGSVDGIKKVTISGNGSAEFGVWQYISAGTYKYKIYEENTSEKGYSYDTTVYTIIDKVSDIDGKLVLARTVQNSTGQVTNVCNFTNIFKDSSIIGPITGDSSNLLLYGCLILFSGVSLLFILLVLKKRKKNRQDAGGQNINSPEI